MRFLLSLLATTLVAALPLSARAQEAPTYAVPDASASADEQIHGRIVSFDGSYDVRVDDERGFVDRIRLHDGTIINPTGLTLAPGMVVSVLGFNAGGYFSANEIDTPYTSNDGGWYYRDHPYDYYGSSIGLSFFFGDVGWWHGAGYRGYGYSGYGGYGGYGHGGHDRGGRDGGGHDGGVGFGGGGGGAGDVGPSSGGRAYGGAIRGGTPHGYVGPHDVTGQHGSDGVRTGSYRGTSAGGGYHAVPNVGGGYRPMPAVGGGYRSMPSVGGGYRAMPSTAGGFHSSPSVGGGGGVRGGSVGGGAVRSGGGGGATAHSGGGGAHPH